jgi:hypothetical protein
MELGACSANVVMQTKFKVSSKGSNLDNALLSQKITSHCASYSTANLVEIPQQQHRYCLLSEERNQVQKKTEIFSIL